MNDLSLHIIDIIQNSLSAGATLIKLTVNENIKEDLLTIEIEDNGKGMTPQQVMSLEDPFFTSRTTRRVGMGIPLFKQSALQSGGDLIVLSEPGVGTKVTATFKHSHIDRPPLGDLANSFILMVSANPERDFYFKYIYNGTEYHFDSVEVKEVLEGLPVNEPSVIRMLTGMVDENIKEIKEEN
ncbi:MAG TPA: ATP-binding protein [Rikenellaceae bacterium]|nr:MAG: histidine kinase [Bacteroidetes bacterium GWE2_40_15]HBZ24936.1 ATP-binding protein [Rikenellaceae bacterium]